MGHHAWGDEVGTEKTYDDCINQTGMVAMAINSIILVKKRVEHTYSSECNLRIVAPKVVSFQFVLPPKKFFFKISYIN